jgi:anti-sigma regulatory factor (Ser/Thr protein kinase)
MASGLPVAVLHASADLSARKVERPLHAGGLRARLEADILPGLERLDDPDADVGELIALAGAQGRRLRAALERPEHPADLGRLDAAARRAHEEDRDWVRGHLHDTALQILEFIAGDGFGTGLSARKIAHLAGGAARDLRRWLEAESAASRPQLVLELERVTAEARALDPSVRLVVGELAEQPTGEQVSALSGAVREAMTNARKHANASQVVVHVSSAGDGATAVTVTDDGVGFDVERAAGGSGLGVRRSILGRMHRVGGHASLESEPGRGTRVTLLTPTLEARS